MSFFKAYYPWAMLLIAITCLVSAGLAMRDHADWWSFIGLFIVATFALAETIEGFFEVLSMGLPEDYNDDEKN